MTHSIRTVLLLATAAVAGYVYAYFEALIETPDISPGTEIAGGPIEELMFISYTTRDGTLTAQRSSAKAEFSGQRTFSDGSLPQHCSSNTIKRAVAAISPITAKRPISLNQRDREFPIQLGVLDLRGGVVFEPEGTMIIFLNRSHDAVALIVDKQAFEVSIPPQALFDLAKTCR